MVLDKLSSSLKESLAKVARGLFVDDRVVNEFVKDMQRTLLQADVNVNLVFSLTQSIKKRTTEEKTPSGITKQEHFIHIVYEELVRFLGGERNEIQVKKDGKEPFKIAFIGLYGSGKSTSIGKIARYYSKRGFKVAAIGLDVHRLAAQQQLKQLCDKIQVPCFIDEKEKNPLTIYKHYEKELEKFDLVLIDTAGRDALSTDLTKELEQLNKTIRPHEKILVISADLGQAAQKQAESFNVACGITGVLITKLDGTAKGGGALTACAATNAPVVFIGTGEKVDDLEPFIPSRFVGRILGMGDLETLLEKAKEVMEEKDTEELSRRFLKGEFNFLDLYEQMEAMGKMGPLSKIVELIPGMGGTKIPKEMLDVQEGKLKIWKFILQSCTKEELEDPDIITKSRIERIAKGAGVTVSDVRDLIKQYKQSKKVVKLLKGTEDPQKLLKKFKGKLPKGFTA